MLCVQEEGTGVEKTPVCEVNLEACFPLYFQPLFFPWPIVLFSQPVFLCFQFWRESESCLRYCVYLSFLFSGILWRASLTASLSSRGESWEAETSNCPPGVSIIFLSRLSVYKFPNAETRDGTLPFGGARKRDGDSSRQI